MFLRRLTLAAAAVVCTLPVHAQFVADPANDFVPVHAGGYVPSLDVLFAYGLWTPASQTFTLGAVMAGAISTMPAGSSFVWGFDRSGLNAPESFVTGTPATGGGVNFDSVLSFGAGGTTATVIQRVVGPVSFVVPGTAPTTPIPGSAIQISGNVITIDIPAAALPSLGRSFAQYTWNLWPRTGPGNAAITDFAPNDVPIVGTAAQRYGDAMAPFAIVTVVPEPASAALMLAGVAALALLRRRRPA